LSQFARLPGLDGNAKMSKSLNNAILISDEPDEIKAKLRKAVTDPLKVRKNDPGRPEVCLVFTYHKKFNPEEIGEIEAGCRSGSLGCVECKLKCSNKIEAFFEPIRAKRKELESKPDLIKQILIDGESRARKVAQATMNEVHEKMKFG
jgi:tryptophanyl-tRNA synthetase